MSELMEDLAELRSEIETERKRHDKKMRILEQKLALLLENEEESGSEQKKRSIKKREVAASDSEEEVEKKPVKKVEEKKIEPGSEDDTSFSEFEREALRVHNAYRAKHGVPPLKLTRELCSFSGEWAQHLANTRKMQHRPSCGKGENIYMSGGRSTVTGTEAVKAWYDEIQSYRFGGQGFSSGTGHFTQVVWRDSKELGVGWAGNNSRQFYVVANYLPAGNFQGRFLENVPPPQH